MAQLLFIDLRRRVTAAISQGKSRRAAAEQFSISAASAVRLQKRLEETGSLEPDRVGRPKGSSKLGSCRQIIIARVEEQPDITMPDLAAWFVETHGVRVDPSNLSKLLCRAGFSYKKRCWRRNANALTSEPSVKNGTNVACQPFALRPGGCCSLMVRRTSKRSSESFARRTV